MGQDLQGAWNVICPYCGGHSPTWLHGRQRCDRGTCRKKFYTTLVTVTTKTEIDRKKLQAAVDTVVEAEAVTP